VTGDDSKKTMINTAVSVPYSRLSRFGGPLHLERALSQSDTTGAQILSRVSADVDSHDRKVPGSRLRGCTRFFAFMRLFLNKKPLTNAGCSPYNKS
jgi:hypothetical protein